MTTNMEKFEIHVKGGFSERKGIKRFSDIVQTNDLNTRTRNKLYNVVYELLTNEDNYFSRRIVSYIYTEVFSLPSDDIPINEYGIGLDYGETLEVIKNIFDKKEYNEIFDFLEGIIQAIHSLEHYYYQKGQFIENINNVFVNENVNYRIINSIITDIVNEEEIKSIEETLNNPYDTVKKHYNKAIEKLYKDKDYANSIKESISSVEAMCQVINGGKEELNKALRNLKIKIHPALEQAYIKIYSYTSDENGARHANGVGEKDATFSEAKYMLISCSAFVNYLKENIESKEE